MDVGIERLLSPLEHRRRQDGSRRGDGAECCKRGEFGWEQLSDIRCERNGRLGNVPGSMPCPCTSLRKRGLVPKTETLESFSEQTRRRIGVEVNPPFEAEEPEEVPHVGMER